MPLDTISTFDSSANKYDVGPTLSQKKRAAELRKIEGVKKDSIETSKEEGRTLSPALILAKPGKAVSEKAMKIARAGRYIFFSFSIPPFFLFYTLPKWVVNHLSPKVLSNLSFTFLSIKNTLNHLQKKILNSITSSIRNIIGRLIWAPNKVNKSSHFFQKRWITFSQALSKYTITLKKVFTRWGEGVRSFVEKGGKRFISDLNSIYQRMESQFLKIHAATIQPVFHWFSEQATELSCKLQPLLEQCKEKFSKLSDLSQELAKPIKKNIQKTLSSASTAVNELGQQILQYAQPIVNLLVPLAKSAGEWGKLLSIRSKKLFLYLPNKIGSSLTAASRSLHHFFQKSNKRVNAWLGFVESEVERIIPFLHPLVGLFRRFRLFLKRVVTILIKGFYHLFSLLSNRLQQVLRTLIKSAKRVFLHVMYLIRSAIFSPWQTIKQLIRSSVKASFKVLKISLLIIIGCGLVFRYWFAMLFELSEEVMSWRNQHKPG